MPAHDVLRETWAPERYRCHPADGGIPLFHLRPSRRVRQCRQHLDPHSGLWRRTVTDRHNRLAGYGINWSGYHRRLAPRRPCRHQAHGRSVGKPAAGVRCAVRAGDPVARAGRAPAVRQMGARPDPQAGPRSALKIMPARLIASGPPSGAVRRRRSSLAGRFPRTPYRRSRTRQRRGTVRHRC